MSSTAHLNERSFSRPVFFALAGIFALLLGGCAEESAIVPVQPAKTTAAPVTADALAGRWGLASYLQEKDKERTEKQAGSLCNKPYVIKKGPNGGVIMHLADEKDPQELDIKTGPDGAVYIGPAGPPGIPEDRQVASFDGTRMVTEWVDPSVAERYGTMVYARCKGK